MELEGFRGQIITGVGRMSSLSVGTASDGSIVIGHKFYGEGKGSALITPKLAFIDIEELQSFVARLQKFIDTSTKQTVIPVAFTDAFKEVEDGRDDRTKDTE